MKNDKDIIRFANPGEEKELSTAALTSGLAYQRPVKQAVVNRLIRHWNSKLLTPIVVSQRDSKNYVVDGQHRLTAMRRMNGGKDVIVPCLVYTGLTYAQEAEMYHRLEKSKGHLQLASDVKARLESGADAEMLDIDQRIADAGFTWALDKPTGAACEIQPTRAVISAYRKLGGPAFSRMLELLAGAWHGSQVSLKSGMIAGMALFLKTYETEIDDYTFVARLSQVDPFDIAQLAKVDFTTDRRSLRYARVIRKKYNAHPGGKKLRYRFED
ncbi:DUF6551 family protein [Oscillospiraceae bacterium 21-37]